MSPQRHLVPALVCMMAPVVACIAQTPVTVTIQGSGSGQTPNNIYAVDLNGDGVPDILQDTSQLPNGFTISIAKGNGFFKTPAAYSVPDGTVSPTPIAVGDFNNDGKADIAITLTGTNQVVVYLGVGDGTFEPPKSSTVTLPEDEVFAGSPLAAADFNHDGDVDLAAVSSNNIGQSAVSVLVGDGAGGFRYGGLVVTPPPGATIQNMTVGDFDADTNADVALVAQDNCGAGNSACASTLHVLYGNGSLEFTDTTPYVSSGELGISAGDLNGDGSTDLFGIDYALNELAVFYSQTGRTFANYFLPLPIPPTGKIFNAWMGPLAMADFNADGHMDLVAHVWNPDAGIDQFMLFLANGSPGGFTAQLLAKPFWVYNTAPVVGDFNGDTKPDMLVSQADEDTAAPDNGPSELIVGLNGTPGGVWSNCDYPTAAEGIAQCSPILQVTSPINFNASAASFGQIRKMELWIDGKKIAEQHHSWGHYAWFSYTLTTPLSQGTHEATWFAVDVDNRKQQSNFEFTVSVPPCYQPSSDGVVICSPLQNGFSYGSPVTVAAGATVSGTLARMEVWVDGVKRYTETSSPFMGTFVTLPAGLHRFDVYAVNTAGTKWEATQTVTVGP